jgi:hypothetical protein
MRLVAGKGAILNKIVKRCENCNPLMNKDFFRIWIDAPGWSTVTDRVVQGPPDFVALTLLIGYPAFLIGLTFGASNGWMSPLVIGCFTLAAIGLASFVWIELFVTEPLIDVDIFKQRALAAALATVVPEPLVQQPLWH